MIEAVIVTKALQDNALDTLINKRITPASDPVPRSKAILPRITYQRISTTRNNTNDGPTKLATARLDLNIYAATIGEVHAVADRVRRIFDGFAGAAVTQGGRTVSVGHIAVTDQDDQPGEHWEGSEKPTQRIRIELRAQWHEA